MGANYQITIDTEKLLAPQIKLNQTELNFTTPAFAYQLEKAEYYQDPQEAQKRSTIFHVQFNAPVDVASFEKQILLGLVEGKSKSEKKLNFSVVYDEKSLMPGYIRNP